jgi:hypothetical protein
VLCFYRNDENGIAWQLTPDACDKYIAAIASTNQYAVEVSAFSNHLYQFAAGYNRTNMTLAEKTALLWNPTLTERLQKEYPSEYGAMLGGALPSTPAPQGACPYPSILAFKIVSDLPAEWEPPLLECKVHVLRGETMEDVCCFYWVNGSWRFSPQ